MNTLNLDIVTPNGSVYNRDNVELVVMQTTAGERRHVVLDIFQL